MKRPILEVRKYNENGVYSYALFRSDQVVPIIKNISKQHARHLHKICNRMDEVPTHIIPIKDWYEFDEIVAVDEFGYGKT